MCSSTNDPAAQEAEKQPSTNDADNGNDDVTSDDNNRQEDNAANGRHRRKSTDYTTTPVGFISRQMDLKEKESSGSHGDLVGEDDLSVTSSDADEEECDDDDDDFAVEEDLQTPKTEDDDGSPANEESLDPTKVGRKALFRFAGKSRFAASDLHLQSDIDLIKKRLRCSSDKSYMVENDSILLHGYLFVQIVRAKWLKNGRTLAGCRKACCHVLKGGYEPYVSVYAGRHKLVKTPTNVHTINPEWKHDAFVAVCHPIRHLLIQVKRQERYQSFLIGQTKLSVEELIRFDDSSSDVRLKRTGVYKRVNLDDEVTHGTLEYWMEFIPHDLIHSVPKSLSPAKVPLPGAYFPERTQNSLQLYVDADDTGLAPIVRYGPGQKKSWQPARYFRDVYDAVCQAQKLIYIVGWSVDYTLELLRGEEKSAGRHKKQGGDVDSYYSSHLGDLLEEKSNEGVVVNLLVWNDLTSNMFIGEGVVATRDEELRRYGNRSNINLRLVPRKGTSNIVKRIQKSYFYTHHQKCVIADTPEQELVAFVGGIDLTYGRYDSNDYPLFRTLQTTHSEDFHNACSDVSPQNGPRQPWHDIHARVQGPGTLDLLQNFEERWISQDGSQEDLVSLKDAGLQATCNKTDNDNSWNTQLYRSIDNTTAKFRNTDFETMDMKEARGITDENKTKGGRESHRFSSSKFVPSIFRIGKDSKPYIIDESQHGDGFKIFQPLDKIRDGLVDSSAHKSLVYHIRQAQHCVYIESQYFLSSSHLWDHHKSSTCCNMVAAELTYKICQKIALGERFSAYIVIPMWPEGLPSATSVQDILCYQGYTISFMYKTIHRAIVNKRKTSKDYKVVKVTDYLSFFTLANRETNDGGQDMAKEGILNQTRRHLIYVVSLSI